MIRPSGIIPFSAVVPIIEYIISSLRHIGVILYPAVHILEEFDHLAAAALCRDDVGISGLDGRRRAKGGAPCVRVLDFKPSCQGLMCIVNVNNLLVGALRLITALTANGDIN